MTTLSKRNGERVYAGTYLVQASTNVNGRRLNSVIDNLRKWRQKVGRVDFRIEEYFWGEEALVPNVHRVLLVMKVSGWWVFKGETIVRDP